MYDTAEEIIKGLNEKDKAVMPALIRRYGKRVFDKANEIIKNEDISKRAMRNTFVALLEYEGAFENEEQLVWYLERTLVQSSAKLLSQRYKDVPEDTLVRRSNVESEAALAAAAAAKAAQAEDEQVKDEPINAEAAQQKEEQTQAINEQTAEMAEPEPAGDESTELIRIESETVTDMDRSEPPVRKKPGRLLSVVGIFITLAVLLAVLINFEVIPF